MHGGIAACLGVCAKDCTTAVDPSGASGRSWCYVEVSVASQGAWVLWSLLATLKGQVASAGPQKWDLAVSFHGGLLQHA